MKEYQLPKEFATKWVEALRSGEYKQGKSQLKSKKGYCCLGVACKMEGQRIFKDKEWIDPELSNGLNKYPKHIPSLLIGSAADNSFVHEVSDMNDNGKTFNEIADWIEENVEFV